MLYVQKFVPHEGHDLRVMVLDGRVLGGMRRYGGGDFRTNISRQGRGEKVTLTSEQEEWGLRASEAVGTHIAGGGSAVRRGGAGIRGGSERRAGVEGVCPGERLRRGGRADSQPGSLNVV
ncbi:MAG: hypothetical protein U0903_11380 [Planctomycetales bacterium]